MLVILLTVEVISINKALISNNVFYGLLSVCFADNVTVCDIPQVIATWAFKALLPLFCSR